MFSHLKQIVRCVVCVSTCAAVASASLVFAERKPNIVVIFTDDHGYADLSCQGIMDDIRTPHIDSLAKSGVRMTSGYVTAPQCVPSRAGLLSGRYQNRLGVEGNGYPLDGFDTEQTIAERLKLAGYATGMTGKWHLGPSSEITTHGFDDVFYQGGSWTNFDIDGKDVPPGTRFNNLYHIDAGSAAASAYITRHHQQPFFLYVAYRAPHVPLDATEKYLKRFPGEMPERRRQALAMLSAVDDGVGMIVDTLRRFDLEQKTLIFFIGDNGAPLKIHKADAPGGGPGWDGSLNDPLNGEKGMLTEGGVRVPFVVSWPGTIPAEQTYSHPVISLDVAATAVAIAGLQADSDLDGENLIPYLTGKSAGAPHETLYWRWISQSAIREGKWKYLKGGDRDYLFDLEDDPEEEHDLLEDHRDIAQRLRMRLSEWANALNPPGLETQRMSETWENYFDFYLDGKPAVSPSRETRSGSTVEGWIVRNGSQKLTRQGLQIRPERRAAKSNRTFITQNGLKVPPRSTVAVELNSRSGGSIALEWREQGQKDFAEGQKVEFSGRVTSKTSEFSTELTAGDAVIHIRLLLPPAGADIRQIRITDPDGKLLNSWNFVGN